MVKKIKVRIGKDGKMTVDMDGYTGQECVRDADKLKQRLEELGLKTETTKNEKRREFCETEPEYAYEGR